MNDWLQRGLLVMLAVSLTINLALAATLRGQDVEVQRLTDAVIELKKEARLGRGTMMPALVGEDEEGAPWSLDPRESGNPTLLYVYSSTCVWCARNLENVRHLADMVRSGYRVVGVSLSDTPIPDRVREIEILGFPVIFSVSEESLRSYRLSGTPQTLLVGPDGALMENWTGAWSGRLAQRIESFFQVRLPGLPAEAAGG